MSRWVLLATFLGVLALAAASKNAIDAAVQKARGNLDGARMNLLRTKNSQIALREAKHKAESEYKAAAADYKNKLSLKNSADQALQTANSVVSNRQMAVNSQSSVVKTAINAVDTDNKNLPEKESHKAKLARSMAAVNTFPASVVAASTAELKDFQKALDSWYKLAETNRATLTAAQTQLKGIQGTLDAAKAEQLSKSTAASLADQATAQAKSKADMFLKVQTDSQAAYRKAHEEHIAAYKSVIDGIAAVKNALQTKITAMQQEVKDKEDAVTTATQKTQQTNDQVTASKARSAKLDGQIKEVEAHLKASELELVKTESEMHTAKTELDSATSRVQLLHTKLTDAQNEAVNFKNPIP